jgi:hypothetical protein
MNAYLPCLLAVSLLLSDCGSHSDAATAATTGGGSDATNAIAPAPAAAAPASSAGAIDLCALVTVADAQAVIGANAKLSKDQKENEGRASSCSFEAIDQSKGVNLLMVEVSQNEDANEATMGLGINRKMYDSEAAGKIYQYDALTGVGDDAFLVANKMLPGVPEEMSAMMQDQQMLFAIKNDRSLQITTSYSGKPRAPDAIEDLAKKVAAAM